MIAGLLLLALAAAGPEAVSQAVAKVTPAVVTIDVARLVQNAQPRPGQEGVAQVQSVGSGFVFDPRGYVLTCNHVVADYERIEVQMADGTRYSGPQVVVLGRDPVTDLAVLRVDAGRPLDAAELANSDSLVIGQWVASVGNPYGLAGSATAGVISGLSRWGLHKSSGPDFQDFIQTDALVNPGNSGGPLVDMLGRVVGICSFAKTSSQHELTGIGFATAITLARQVAAQLVEHGKVIRGQLGMNTQPVTGGIARALGLDNEGGALVASVDQGSQAAAAGIRPGDIVLKLDAEPVPDVRWLQNGLAARMPGDSVKLLIRRGGKTFEVTATFSAWPVAGIEPKQAPPVRNWLGILAGDLDDASRSRTRSNYGVVIQAIEPAGPADNAGLLSGDVIIEINLSPVKDKKTYDDLAASMAGSGKPVLVRLLRGPNAFYAAVGP